MLTGLWHDVKYGARLIQRRPGFSATAVLVLSLGIGVNTALFSVVNGLLLTPLPVIRPDALFYIYRHPPAGRIHAPLMGAAELDLLRAQTGSLADYTLHAQYSASISIDATTDLETGELVSGDYFAILGVRARLGRTLEPRDDDPAGEPAIVISHALWARRFQSRADVVGRVIRVGDRFATVVGVTSPEFSASATASRRRRSG